MSSAYATICTIFFALSAWPDSDCTGQGIEPVYRNRE